MVTSNSENTYDDVWIMPDYIHTLLLWKRDSGNQVLMLRQDSTDSWDLPYLTYPDSLRNDGDRFAADLERMLSVSALPDRRAFTVVAELLGAYGGAGLTGDDPVGFALLMLVEPQIALCEWALPPQAEWKDARFVASLLESSDKGDGNRGALEVTLEYLRISPDRFSEPRDPRYRFGWFKKAVSWLRTEAERHGAAPTGRVTQDQVSSSSTLLCLNCSGGDIYLKAPALGCEEISISVAVASLFPGKTVDVLGTSDELNSFIMRGFKHVEPKKAQYEVLVKTLGNIQLQSLNHLETLKAAGCEERGPVQIAEKMRDWADDKDVKSIFLRELFKLEKSVPIVADLCSKLAAYNIPLTLVHGDFAQRNATVASTKVVVDGPTYSERGDVLCDSDADGSSGSIILFDWQYACISHPFCDLHEMYKDLPEHAVNAYLDIWSDFEPRERAREAFEIAVELGWCLKMWTSLECFRQCNLQRKSCTAEFVYDAFCSLYVYVCEILPPDSDHSSSEDTVSDSDMDAGETNARLLQSPGAVTSTAGSDAV